MGETTRLNVPSMFDLRIEAVRCDRNDVLPLLTRDQHATNTRVIRVNNTIVFIKLYLRRGKFIICCRVWRLDDSHWRKQSLGPVFLKPINTNIIDSQADEIIKSRRHLCCPHTASVLQFLNYTRNFFYCHKYTNTRRFGTSLLPSSGADDVVWKWKKKNIVNFAGFTHAKDCQKSVCYKHYSLPSGRTSLTRRCKHRTRTTIGSFTHSGYSYKGRAALLLTSQHATDPGHDG